MKIIKIWWVFVFLFLTIITEEKVGKRHESFIFLNRNERMPTENWMQGKYFSCVMRTVNDRKTTNVIHKAKKTLKQSDFNTWLPDNRAVLFTSPVTVVYIYRNVFAERQARLKFGFAWGITISRFSLNDPATFLYCYAVVISFYQSLPWDENSRTIKSKRCELWTQFEIKLETLRSTCMKHWVDTTWAQKQHKHWKH